MKVTTRRPVYVFVRAARELMDRDPAPELEVVGLGNAINTVARVSTATDYCRWARV